MGTIKDYIKWRGDLEISRDGFNIIDNLVLSCISYMEIGFLFQGDQEEKSLQKASDEYFATIRHSEPHKKSLLDEVPPILKLAGNSKRFRDFKIRNYINHIDANKTLQFSAMEFLIPDGTSYIAFRGTDDTLIGWKEDFLLAITEVQSEIESVAYLNYVASCSDRKLRIGGHSKGGHLAVYSSALCNPDYQDRIIEIFSNDGPGFSKGFVNSREAKSISSKIRRIIPKDSVVGMIMEPIGEAIVVESTNRRLLQHDLLSWCVEGNLLTIAPGISKNSKEINKSISDWIRSFDTEEAKRKFIDGLFDVLTAPGFENLSDLQNGGIHSFQAMAKQLNQTSHETRSQIRTMIKLLVHEAI